MAESDFISWYQSTFNYSVPAPVGKGAGTPYYRYWELAVNVPLPNPRFSQPKKIRETTQAILASATTIDIVKGSGTLANILLNDLGVGLARVSKADGSLSEVVEVVSAAIVTTTTVRITLRVAITNAFAANSIFEKYSEISTDQWQAQSDLFYPVSSRKAVPAILDDLDGKVMAQKYRVSTASLTSTRVIQAPLTLDIFRYLNSAYTYRVGGRYHIDWGSLNSAAYASLTPDVYLALTTYTTPKVMQMAYYLSTSLVDQKFYNFNKVISQSPIAYTTAQQYASIEILKTGTIGATTNINVTLDELYWEHSGGIESSLGVVLLPNAPDRDSLDINKDDNGTLVKVGNGDKFGVNNYGNPNYNPKYTLGAHFDSVPLGILNKFKILEQFQNDGFLMNLHTHLNELPQCLTGKFTISNIKKSNTNFQKTSFDLFFEEM